MTAAPLSIRRFETLQIASVMITLINGFALIEDDVLGSIVNAVVLLALTFLVSRKRKNWARWVLLAFFAFGLAVLAWGFAFVPWNASTLLSFGYLPLAMGLLGNLMEAVAIVLLFTPESAAWLGAKASLA